MYDSSDKHRNKNAVKTSKKQKRGKKSLALRPKVCKYCKRRFLHRFWRYHRHLRSHERRYTRHWFGVTPPERKRLCRRSSDEQRHKQTSNNNETTESNRETALPKIKEEVEDTTEGRHENEKLLEPHPLETGIGN